MTTPMTTPDRPKPSLPEARLKLVMEELKDANRVLDRIRALPRYDRADLSGNERYVRDEELRRILDSRKGPR